MCLLNCLFTKLCLLNCVNTKLCLLNCPKQKKKSRIRETPTLSTDAASRTDTNLKRLRDLSSKKILIKKIWGVNFYFFGGGGVFPPFFSSLSAPSLSLQPTPTKGFFSPTHTPVPHRTPPHRIALHRIAPHCTAGGSILFLY